MFHGQPAEAARPEKQYRKYIPLAFVWMRTPFGPSSLPPCLATWIDCLGGPAVRSEVRPFSASCGELSSPELGKGYAARFALILQLVRAATGEADETIVDETSMDAGITLSRWFGREAKRIYAMLGESKSDGEQRKLVVWIDRKGDSLTAREVQQGHRRFKTIDDAETALEELVKAGRGYWEPVPTTPKGGRSSRRLTLSTPSTSTSTSTKPQESS